MKIHHINLVAAGFCSSVALAMLLTGHWLLFAVNVGLAALNIWICLWRK